MFCLLAAQTSSIVVRKAQNVMKKQKGVGAIRQSRISTYFDHTQPIIISLGFCVRKKSIA